MSLASTSAVRSHVFLPYGVFAYRSAFLDWSAGNSVTNPGPFTDGCITFNGTGSACYLYAYLDGASKFRVKVDPHTPNGTESTVMTLPSGGYHDWVQIASGLDNSVEHTFEVVNVNGASTTTSVSVQGIAMTGGTGVDTVSAAPTYSATTIMGIGHSIMVGQAGTGNDSSQGYMYLLARAEGSDWLNGGIGGTLVWSSGGTNNFISRIGNLTALTPAPTFFLIDGGVNDANQLAGAETAAQFQASYYSLVNSITTAFPSTNVLCLGLIPTGTTPASSNRAAFNAAIQAAIGSGGDGAGHVLTAGQQSQCHYQSGDAYGLVLSSADYGDSSFLHPNGTGYGLIEPVLQGDLVTSPPGTPTGLGNTTTVQNTLTWSTLSLATGYRIYRDGGGSPIYDGAATTYTDSVTLGSLHTYQVTGYNIAGESAKSSALTVSTSTGVPGRGRILH